MIIVDLNQVMISNLMVTLGSHASSTAIEEDLLRHFILNSIRSYNTKFKNEFGEMVIAADGKNCWRKEIFPYYKANRKKSREKSDMDWTAIFESLNKIREELKLFFPYRVIHFEGAEADDVIGTLVHKYGNTNEKILILSGDKDFIQLHTYMNVRQYDPVKKKFITNPNPSIFIKEHIMRGDTGDGIPNFLSADNTFVTAARQKPLSQKKLDSWVRMQPNEFCDDNMLRNYKRNEQLIDLNFIPDQIRETVYKEYEAQSGKSRQHLFNYFIEKKLKNLLESINEF